MSGAKGKGAGATRGQLVLVAVLAVVFVGVMVNNFRGSGDSAVAAPPAPAPNAATAGAEQPTVAAVAPAATPRGPFGEFAADADWPEASEELLTSFDPLASPESLASPGATTNSGTENDIQAMQQAQSAIIFVSGDSRVARIGDQDYHVGDAVGRFLITDISSAGIVLSDPAGDADDR